MGLRALVLARGFGLFSALPAPSTFLPGPDLSDVSGRSFPAPWIPCWPTPIGARRGPWSAP